jgi:protein-L-isoaspartate O-methyltransferase
MARAVVALADGALPAGSPWHGVFAAVPRDAFLPHAYVRAEADWKRLHGGSAAGWERLWRLAATDATVVVQLGADGEPVASCLQPSMAARVLHAASVEDDHRVLELGTGTGYLTGLLCERLGDAQVVTVEIDPDLAALASALLAARGYRPQLVTTDGTAGHPAQAPYDRVIATYAVRRIPTAWIEQTRPGGVLVSPLLSGVARLLVADERHAAGRFLPFPAYILPTRSPTSDAAGPMPPPRGAARPTRLPARVAFDHDFRFFLDLVTPGLRPPDGHNLGAVELHADDGSWARVGLEGVVEAGPRRLWGEVERAHAEWCELGQPGRDRFGLTVTGGSQTVWLDDAAGERRWPLARNPALLLTRQAAG